MSKENYLIGDFCRLTAIRRRQEVQKSVIDGFDKQSKGMKAILSIIENGHDMSVVYDGDTVKILAVDRTQLK